MIAIAAQRRLFWLRTGQALFCGGLGAAGVGLAFSQSSGGNLGVAVALGAILATVIAWMERSPRANPACEIDPNQDEDGLLRCALTLPTDHPLASALLPAAQLRPLRFRTHPWVAPLFAGFFAALVSWIWVQSSTQATTLRLAANSSSSLASANQIPNQAPRTTLSPDSPPLSPQAQAVAAGQELKWVEVPSADHTTVLRAAHLSGVPSSVLQHFLEMRPSSP